MKAGSPEVRPPLKPTTSAFCPGRIRDTEPARTLLTYIVPSFSTTMYDDVAADAGATTTVTDWEPVSSR